MNICALLRTGGCAMSHMIPPGFYPVNYPPVRKGFLLKEMAIALLDLTRHQTWNPLTT